jgi:transketolase
VGFAIAERHIAAEFNEPDFPIFDNYTYVICGDGCMQEGMASEACSLAGHLGLGKLIVLYDDNSITIDGETELSFSEDVVKRFEAYHWHTQTVSDVMESLDDLRAAIKEAQSVTDKPSFIKVKTIIGYGSPSKAGKEEAHGSPLGKEDLAGAKRYFGLSEEMFDISPDVADFYKKASKKGEAMHQDWEDLFAKYADKYPDKAAEISRRFARKLPDGILDKLPALSKSDATRKHSQACLNAIGPNMPELVGGSADLTPSNLTLWKGATDFQKDTPEGRYFRFGVREHGMVAATNGIFAYGGLRPFCATFLVFTTYCMAAIRMCALSHFGVLFIMTHDSIGLGEDGPTHQAVEVLESLRAMPGINVYRPADGKETAGAYKSALEHAHTPTVICLTRQATKALDKSSIDKTTKGAYACIEEDNPDLVLIGTGSEVGPCVDAAEKLKELGVKTRVVSMPCQETFLKQSKAYQASVLPGSVPTLSVEAASPNGWHRFSHSQVAMMEFGRSGKGSEVMKYFGFTPDFIVEKGQELIKFYKDAGSVPDLNSRPPPMAPKTDDHKVY